MSYATYTEGDTFLADWLNTDPWFDALSTEKTKALAMATRLIDRLSFQGEKTDEDQTLQFPRGDDTVVPDDIKNATILLAMALLDGKDPELEADDLRTRTQSITSARITHNTEHIPEHIASGIPSLYAWNYLRPYLRDQRGVDLLRIN